MNEPVYPRLASTAGHLTIVLLLAALALLVPALRGHPTDGYFWQSTLAVLPALAGAYLLNLRVALPRLLFRGRWAPYLLLFLGLTAGVVALAWAAGGRAAAPDDRLTVVAFCAVFVLGTGTARGLAQNADQEGRHRRQAETGKLEAELAYLRAQLNPHVFFNTLNSIYVLADLNLPQAKQALIRLSRLMRYLLYQTHEARVPLSQEITFLEDYIALMKLRLTPNMQIEFEHPAPAAAGAPLLAPMLLQPFVENAFKFGLSTTQPSAIFVRLDYSPETQGLHLEVRNRVFAVPQTGFDTGSGIGLANTRRRLELLYPGRHTLALTERNEAGEFVVHLTLHLS